MLGLSAHSLNTSCSVFEWEIGIFKIGEPIPLLIHELPLKTLILVSYMFDLM